MRAPLLLVSLALATASLHCRERDTRTTPPRVEPSPATVSDAATHVDAGAPLQRDASRDAAMDAQITADSLLSQWRYFTDGGVQVDLPPSALVGVEGRSNDARIRITPAAITERSGRAPAMNSVREALRRQLASGASYLPQGAFNALGDGRFVAIIQRTDRAFPDSPTLLVVVASERDGQAQIEDVAELPTHSVFQGAHGECNLTVRGRELRDIDGDGELELSIAVSYCSQPVCPTGSTSYEYLAVYDLVPAPRLAVMVARAIHPESDVLPKRTRRTQWSDVNRDGHADLIVEGEDCQFLPSDSRPATATAASLGCRSFDNDICCVDRREVVLYDPSSDLWHPGGNGASPVVYSPCNGGVTEK